jgi:hypothetical protein
MGIFTIRVDQTGVTPADNHHSGTEIESAATILLRFAAATATLSSAPMTPPLTVHDPTVRPNRQTPSQPAPHEAGAPLVPRKKRAVAPFFHQSMSESTTG